MLGIGYVAVRMNLCSCSECLRKLITPWGKHIFYEVDRACGFGRAPYDAARGCLHVSHNGHVTHDADKAGGR